LINFQTPRILHFQPLTQPHLQVAAWSSGLDRD